MNVIESLEEYLRNDIIYKDYQNGHTDFNDFEIFCIEHCQDIEKMLLMRKRILEYCKQNVKNNECLTEILDIIKECEI